MSYALFNRIFQSIRHTRKREFRSENSDYLGKFAIKLLFGLDFRANHELFFSKDGMTFGLYLENKLLI